MLHLPSPPPPSTHVTKHFLTLPTCETQNCRLGVQKAGNRFSKLIVTLGIGQGSSPNSLKDSPTAKQEGVPLLPCLGLCTEPRDTWIPGMPKAPQQYRPHPTLRCVQHLPDTASCNTKRREALLRGGSKSRSRPAH
jgi:hypothetical protein